MDFNLNEWKQKISQNIQGWKERFQRTGISTLYYGLAATSLLPVIQAASYQLGDVTSVLVALGGVFANVGTNLLANKIQGWKDKSEAEIAAELQSLPELKDLLDQLLEKTEIFAIAQRELTTKDDLEWFEKKIREEFLTIGSRLNPDIILIGSGVIAKGDNAVAMGAGGVMVSGDTGQLNVVQGDHNQTVNAQTYINKQVIHNAAKEAKSSYQLPPLPPQGIFGREDEILSLTDFLKTASPENAGLTPVALLGMGGIGKTTLALSFAYKFSGAFPDGVLWTSLGPKPITRLLLDAWGRALDIDLLPERDEAACKNRLRQHLHYKRILIVVDDIWNIIHGDFFLVGGPYSRTLITTREKPIANHFTTPDRVLGINVLKPEASLELLYKLAPETKQVDKKISMRLCERLEFLPLAITLAGRMIANESDIPERMQRLVGELIERREARLNLLKEDGRPGLDEDNPVSLQAILGMSVERLSKSDQERFAMLSVFGGEPLTWEIKAVTAVWETSIEDTEATLTRFIQRGLVEPRNGRFWMHALLADYAGYLVEEMDL
ncbi:MAG: hypothetical protein KF758_16705 [Anaerolineales bacterium]|nr:hypothetical protein [Anaerolineales bacterium]